MPLIVSLVSVLPVFIYFLGSSHYCKALLSFCPSMKGVTEVQFSIIYCHHYYIKWRSVGECEKVLYRQLTTNVLK